MKSPKILVLFFCALFVSFATIANAQKILTGNTEGGALFKIIVPDNWNGDLVLWNHGLSFELTVDLGPMADLQLVEGYAVAASSFRQTGWSLFKSKVDLQNLLGIFKENFGHPQNLFIMGASEGGLVTAAALEEANLGNIAGALTLCSPLAGSRNWELALDLRLIYDAVCSQVPGAAIPGGAEGLPEGFSFTSEQLASAVNTCTGVLLPPLLRIPQQVANLEMILEETQIPESFLLNDMWYATFALSDLVHAKEKLNGKIAIGNTDVSYDNPQINETIERVSPNPGASNRLEKHFTPKGDVGETKIVSLYTDKDGLVIVENAREYAEVVPISNLTTAIVVETEPSHCGFSPAEVVATWEVLRAWVATGGPQPTAAHIQATCLALEGIYDGPCRIDPNFDIQGKN